MRPYLVKIRLNGIVSWVEVTARDSSHAKSLVSAQYGNSVDILSTTDKRDKWSPSYPANRSFLSAKS
jgi:hypothetical protein